MSKEAYQPKGFIKGAAGAGDLPYNSCTVYFPQDTVCTVVDQYGNTEAAVTFLAGQYAIRLKKITAADGDFYLMHSNDEDAV